MIRSWKTHGVQRAYNLSDSKHTILHSINTRLLTLNLFLNCIDIANDSSSSVRLNFTLSRRCVGADCGQQSYHFYSQFIWIHFSWCHELKAAIRHEVTKTHLSFAKTIRRYLESQQIDFLSLAINSKRFKMMRCCCFSNYVSRINFQLAEK